MAAVDDAWLHIKSPNFELYTHNSEKESRALLHDLELLRALFFDRLKFTERARLDVTVFAFKRRQDFAAYSPPGMAGREVGGFYLANTDRAIINLAPFDDWDGAQRVVFHEYVHHLFRAVDQVPPLWFNEGMAELLSAIREESGHLEFGQPHIGRVAVLQTEKLLPLETLFAVDHASSYYQQKDHAGLFYAQAWALLHYWHFGDSGLPKEAISRFIRVASDPLLAASVDLREYFRKCFAMDYPEMVKRLERYVSGGRYRMGKLPAPEVAKSATYVSRSVPREEIRLRLAELSLRTQQSAMGKFVLVDAAAKPNAEARVFEVLGAEALRENDEQKARERWEEAVVAGSTNVAAMRELGLIESRQWFREFDIDFHLPPETAERLRVRLKRSIAIEPEQSAAYEMLAWVEAYSQTPVVANVYMVQKVFSRLKAQQRTLLAFIMARVRMGLKEQALSMLSEFEKLEYEEWSARGAETLRARLENRPARAVVRPLSAREIAATAAEKSPRYLRWPSVEVPLSP